MFQYRKSKIWRFILAISVLSFIAPVLSTHVATAEILNFSFVQDPEFILELPPEIKPTFLKNLLNLIHFSPDYQIESGIFDNNNNLLNIKPEIIFQKKISQIKIPSSSLTIPNQYTLEVTYIKKNIKKTIKKDFTWGLDNELKDKRTLNSKTYKTTDNNLRTIFSTKNLHYQDESNQLQDINTTLIKSKDNQYLYENTSNFFKSYFRNLSSDKLFTKFNINNFSVESGLGQNNSLGNININAEIKIQNNQLIYKNIYPDIDLRYIISSEKVLEEFILSKYRPIDRIDQILKIKGLNYHINKDQTIDLIDKKTNQIIIKIPKPVMYEIDPLNEGGKRKINKHSFGLHYEIKAINKDVIQISKVLDQEGKDWLSSPNRQFPLVVDTVDNFNISAAADDGYLLKNGTNRKLSTAWSNALSATPEVDQGMNLVYARYCATGYSCYINRTYLRLNTSSIPDTDTINSVTLRSYLINKTITTNYTIEVRGNNGSTCWGSTLDSTDFGCGTNVFGTFDTVNLPANNNTFDISLSSSSVNKTGYSELEIRHSDDLNPTAPTDGDTWVATEDFENTNNNEAILIINHTSSSGINLSGTVYTNEGSINIGSSKTVNLRVGGSGTYTAETNSSGYWTINNVAVNSGEIITAYLNDENEKATTVMISDGVGITNVDLYINRLIVRSDTASVISNSNLATGDDGDPDVKYNVSSGTLNVDSGIELHVWTGDTFDPGGIVNTNTTGGLLHLDDDALAYMDTDASSIGIGISLDIGSTLNIDVGTTITGSITAATNSTLSFSTGSPAITLLGNGVISGTGNLIFNNLIIGVGSTVAMDSDITIKGNWINNGYFNPNTKTVTFNGTSSSILNSGCTDVATCTGKSFYNLIINKTAAGSADDNLSLDTSGLKVTNTLTITDGELIQGAYDVRCEGSSAVSIGASGFWNNSSSGDLYLGGTFSNSGTATFQGEGSACGGSDSILIRGVGTTSSWAGSGIFNINDVDVQSQAGTTAITAYSSNNSGGNNTNWTFESCPVTSTSDLATAYSFQRKTFYDNINNRYWKFFNDGSQITGQYSINGADWILSAGSTIPINTNDFSLWHSVGTTEVYIVYPSNFDILVRKGTLSASNIIWDTTYIALNGVSSSDDYNFPSISQDSLGYLFVTAKHTISAGSTTSSFYFNNYSVGETWTNPVNMSDGSTATYASTSTNSKVQLLNSNNNNGTNLGDISKVEVRVHGYTAGDDNVYLRPVFGGTLDGTNNTINLPVSGSWSSYVDITADSNAPSIWTWTDIQNLDVDVQYVKSGGQAALNYVSKVEIQVTYSSGQNYYIKSSRCTTPNDPSGSWSTSDLSDTSNINSNVYSVIVPLNSQNMYSVWEKGTTIEGKKYSIGTSTWDVSPTSIGTGVTGLSNSLQAVSDSSNNVHLTYINSSNQTVYREYTTSWQTPVVLDSNSGNEYPSFSIDTAGGNGLYSFWVRNDDILYRRSCSPYTSWDSPVTLESNGTNKWTSSSYQDFGSGKIFLEWTKGSVSPYNIKWNSITPTTCFTNSAPTTPSLDSPLNAVTNQSITPTLKTTATDNNNDYLYYKIELCTNLAMSVGCTTFDQTINQIGWSGQNTESNTAYTSGTQGVYIIQTPLDYNTTYYWKSYAKDPAGTNNWSNTQTTPYSFITKQAPNLTEVSFRWSNDDGGETHGGSGPWYNQDWGYRQPITITNQVGSSFVDFQVGITFPTNSLYSAGKIQSDCDDLRFTTDDGVTEINYWIASGCNTASTRAWIKIPQINASASTTIYMYYGNSNATMGSNGDDTFDFFDDFNDASLNSSKWTIARGTVTEPAGGYLNIGGCGTFSCDNDLITTSYQITNGIVEYRFDTYQNSIDGQHELTLGARNVGATDPYGNSFMDGGSSNYRHSITLGGTIKAYSSWLNTNNVWYAARVILNSDNLNFTTFADNFGASQSTISYDESGDTHNTTGKIGFHTYVNRKTYIDWVYVRKYATTEPSSNFDNEETSSGASGATWMANENIGITDVPKNTNLRLRFSVKNTGGEEDINLRLQVAPKGAQSNCENVSSGNFSDVPTTVGSSVGVMTTSPNFSDQNSTTNQLTPSATNFTAGKIIEHPSNQTDSIILANDNYTEVEYNFQLTNNIAGNTSYCFRVVNSTTPLNTYTKVAELTTTAGNQPPNSPTLLTQTKTDDTQISTGDWVNSSSIKFSVGASDPNNPDTIYLCIEKKDIGTSFINSEDSCGSGISYSGVGITLTHTINNIGDSAYHWQARIKDEAGAYSSWVSYDTNPESSIDFGIDTSSPSNGTVYDGLEIGVDKDFNDGSLSSLSANWSGIDATVSGLDHYEYSIGTSVGTTDIKNWTANNIGTSVTVTGLTLQTSSVYHFNVRAIDNANNIQTAISSDGQVVAPSLSFQVTPSYLSFSNLNPSNNFSVGETTTLATSTNAYGGYIIRAYITGLLSSDSVPPSTIPNFDGGTYLSPDGWQPSDIGFGYHSTKLDNTPCLGGSAPPCYAPFSMSYPGDIVADHTNNVIGNPVSNEKFTIDYKIKTPPAQSSSSYSTTIIYTVTAKY